MGRKVSGIRGQGGTVLRSQAVGHAAQTPAAFTLIEVLVAVAVISLLVALLLPGLGRARQQAAVAVCGSNLRQLVVANQLYARDFGERYVPGAAYIRTRNLDRWHGRRSTPSDAFDPSRSPMVPYLGEDRAVRACPVFEPDSGPDPNGIRFEAGCGGYGYNNAYLGVRGIPLKFDSGEKSTLAGAAVHAIRSPSATVMLADAAFAGEALIEYSFVEPRFHRQFRTRADPSIHFRHLKLANVAWCDGHVSGERRTYTRSSGYYTKDPDRLGIGWFGETDDNSLFDLE
jgi:prepilin-type N-terminal cleavage/methylation domain-containing protein/prepilin-type processing-associated H-X9-DG protein